MAFIYIGGKFADKVVPIETTLDRLYEQTRNLSSQSIVLKDPWKGSKASITNLLSDFLNYAKQQDKSVRDIYNEIINSSNYSSEQKQAATFAYFGNFFDLSPYVANGKLDLESGQEGSFSWFLNETFKGDKSQYSSAVTASNLRIWELNKPSQTNQNVFFKNKTFSVGGEITPSVTGVFSKDDPYSHGHTFTGQVPPLSLTDAPYYIGVVIYIPKALLNASLLGGDPGKKQFSDIMTEAVQSLGGSMDFELGRIVLPQNVTGAQLKAYLNKLSELRTWADGPNAKNTITSGLNDPTDFNQFVDLLANGKFKELVPFMKSGSVLSNALGGGQGYENISVSISPTELSDLAKFSLEGKLYVDMQLFETEKFKGDVFAYFSNTATWMISDKKINNSSRLGLKSMIEMHDIELSPNTSMGFDVNAGLEGNFNKDNKPQFSYNMGADAQLFYKSLFAATGASLIGLMGDNKRTYKQGYVQLGLQPTNRLTTSAIVRFKDFTAPEYSVEASYLLSPNIRVGIEGRYDKFFRLGGNIGFGF